MKQLKSILFVVLTCANIFLALQIASGLHKMYERQFAVKETYKDAIIKTEVPTQTVAIVTKPEQKPRNETVRQIRYDKPSKPADVKIVKWYGKKKMPKPQLHKAINDVLRTLPHIKNTNDFHKLVYETACAETNRGIYPVNVKSSDDIGMFQLRIATVLDTRRWLKSMHPDVYEAVEKFRDKELSTRDNLAVNVSYGVAMAATYYWRRDPSAKISTTTERGKLWKTEYNTHLGKGSVEHYLKLAALNKER